MPAAIAVAALTVASTAYQANQQKKQASKAADQATADARELAATQQATAEKEAAAAAKLQADQQQFEIERLANQELSKQNQTVSDLTPTVQLAAAAPDGDGTAKAARNRRAQFKPEYSSGVSL